MSSDIITTNSNTQEQFRDLRDNASERYTEINARIKSTRQLLDKNYHEIKNVKKARKDYKRLNQLGRERKNLIRQLDQAKKERKSLDDAIDSAKRDRYVAANRYISYSKRIYA